MSKQNNTLAILALGGLGLYLFKDKLSESLGGVSKATGGLGEGISNIGQATGEAFKDVGGLVGTITDELSKLIVLPSRVVENTGDIIYNITETAKNNSEAKKIREGANRETLILDIPRAVTESSLRAGKLKQAQASLAVADLRKTGVLPPSLISLGSATSSSLKKPVSSKNNKTLDVIKKVVSPVPSLVTSIFKKLRG